MMGRVFKAIALLVCLAVLVTAGLLIYGLMNPAFVYRDVVIEVPLAQGETLTETLALQLGERVLKEAGLQGKTEPYLYDRLEDGNNYLHVGESGRGTVMYHSYETGRRFLHIEIENGVARCELWRGK